MTQDRIAPIETVDSPSYKSELPAGPDRFLAYVQEHGLEIDRRKPNDFLRHFSPQKFMQALVDQPELRATILEPTTGVRRKIGMRKSPISAAEDLQFALDERETDAATILQLFRADDRVRHLESTDLWAFVIEGEYWKDVPKDGKERKKLERHYAFMLAQALENGLLSAQDIVASLSPELCAKSLPHEIMAEVMRDTLASGRKGKAYSDADFLATVTIERLVHHLPHVELWNRVIAPHIAQRHGLAAGSKRSEKTDSNKQSSAPEKATAVEVEIRANTKDANAKDNSDRNGKNGKSNKPEVATAKSGSANAEPPKSPNKGRADTSHAFDDIVSDAIDLLQS